jgi:hypothetical protein
MIKVCWNDYYDGSGCLIDDPSRWDIGNTEGTLKVGTLISIENDHCYIAYGGKILKRYYERVNVEEVK